MRVSRVGDRDGERFVSPSEQRQRIEAACERDGLTLVDVIEELDVSGGTALDRRPGLRRAIEAVEAGAATVLVVAYFDRLVRSLAVQAEVVERVERAGGAILAVDAGEVRADTASRWLSSTMLGMVAEYHRRVTAERTKDAKRRAVARGVAPFANLPPGYRRGAGERIEPDPSTAPAVAQAFALRASGATVMEVRDYLRANGVERSFHGVQALLTSRFVLGELRFGELVNPTSHPAIVEPQVWQAVQRKRVSRGRRAKSERLLARLGVLRCGTCGARMVVGSSRPNPAKPDERFWFYRCNPTSDCPRRVAISATVAERTVSKAVRDALRGVEGHASGLVDVEAAEQECGRAEQELEAAVRAFTGLEDVDAARERLLALREERDAARDRLEELRAASVPALTITANGNWDELSLGGQRALIQAVIERATVAPGRGPGRITVETRAQ